MIWQGWSGEGHGPKGRGWDDQARPDSARVVALRDRLEGPEPAAFAQMEGYWTALRGDAGDLPARADFNPRGIADLLHVTMLLERIAPGMVRIRLAGMALADLLGMELRGMPLSALFVPDARDRLAAHVEQVFCDPGILRLRLEGDKGLLRPALTAEMLVLPMRGLDGSVNRALACMVIDGRISRAPRRFSIRAAACRKVPDYAPQAASVTPPPAARSAPAAAPQPAPALTGMAEAATPFAPASRPARSGLRVIDGGRS